jgi:hypothetical protein
VPHRSELTEAKLGDASGTTTVVSAPFNIAVLAARGIALN